MDFLLSQIGGVKFDTTLSQIVQVFHYGIAELSQIERTYKKMNEYLMEMMLSTQDNLSDEEIMIMNSYRKVRINRKKRLKKENDIYGKESNYNLYC